MRSLRGLAIAAASIAVVVCSSSAQAAGRSYPYCAVSRGDDMAYEECAFATFELCLAEIRGLGGYCKPNARYVGPAPEREPNAEAPPLWSRRR